MRLYTPAEALPAAKVSSDDVSNWIRRGGLLLPLADPRPGVARRYHLANVYEFTLIRALMGLGLTLPEANFLLRDRFRFIVESRARELRRPYPGLQALCDDPETWLGLELRNRDRSAPICWVLPRNEKAKLPELQGCAEANVSKLLTAMRVNLGQTEFTVINITELLAQTDAALSGVPLSPLVAPAEMTNEFE